MGAGPKLREGEQIVKWSAGTVDLMHIYQNTEMILKD